LIDKWDQLKDQFTSNFAGAMGRSSTSHGPGYGEVGTGRDPTQVHATLFRQVRYRSRCYRQGGHRPFLRRSLPP
jgi:hypothetical protein